MRRRVCVVTSSRADYNHLYTLMHGIKKSTKLNLSIIVTGMHTIKEYGLSYKEIIKDGFDPDAIIKSNQASSSTKDVLKGMSVQLDKTYKVLNRIKPDTPLDLLIIQETEEHFFNRDEFWITHLRPSVHTRFFVYTPDEFKALSSKNYVINKIKNSIEIIFQDDDKVLG